jgi:hypothetical protein
MPLSEEEAMQKAEEIYEASWRATTSQEVVAVIAAALIEASRVKVTTRQAPPFILTPEQALSKARLIVDDWNESTFLHEAGGLARLQDVIAEALLESYEAGKEQGRDASKVKRDR